MESRSSIASSRVPFVNPQLIIRTISPNEPDLLTGFEFEVFRIKTLDGELVHEAYPGSAGWTCEKLEAIDCFAFSPTGWDAYLGTQWIGSSEI